MPADPISPSKIVFLTKENPFPPSGGAHIRDAHMVQLLRERFDVEILCFSPEGDVGRPAETPLPAGVKVSRVRRTRPPLWRKTLGRLQPEVQTGYCRAMESALRERYTPDTMLWISRLGMAQYLAAAKKIGYRVILDQHQVETQVLWANAYESATRLSTAARGVTDLVTAAQCGYYEGRVCRESDAVIATSDLDASRILRLAPDAPLHIIPNSVDCAQYMPLRALSGGTTLFSGALNYGPNLEALQWYVDEVLPRIRGTMGAATPRLVVAGSNPSSEIQQLVNRAGGELRADPPSLLPFLADAAVVIVPLRSGRSMRFKILEAMAAGRAVVSTPRGSEGLLLAPGYDIWIADAADKFASGVTRLVNSPTLRDEMGAHAAQTVDARYDWKCARPLLDSLLRRLAPSLTCPQ
jgi:glycosyltransferase involved in cell wall biosynthesis